MDKTLQQILLVWAIFAIAFGPFLARSSIRRQPIYGGLLAHIFHLIGSVALVGVVPAIFAALIFGGGFKLAFPVALTLTLTSLFSMLLFAIIEHPALPAQPAQQQDRGWTERDARSSDL